MKLSLLSMLAGAMMLLGFAGCQTEMRAVNASPSDNASAVATGVTSPGAGSATGLGTATGTSTAHTGQY